MTTYVSGVEQQGFKEIGNLFWSEQMSSCMSTHL